MTAFPTPHRLLVATVAAAACTTLLATPALAQTRTTQDAAGDVVSGPEEVDIPTTPEPDRTAADVTSLRVEHRRHVVRLVLREAEVPEMTGDDLAVHILSLRTSEGKRAELDLVTSADRPQGQRVWSFGERTSCRGLRTTVSYADDEVRVTIPRRCLSAPRWVKVGGGAGVLEGDRVFADDASLDGEVRQDVVLGPKVFRG